MKEDEGRGHDEDLDYGEGGSHRRLWAVTVGGGLLGAAIAFGTLLVLGSVGNLEARLLLESSLPTIRFIASAVATATATILALMLTLLSLSHTTNSTLRSLHYQRIAWISWLSSFAIVASIFLLILLALPMGDAEQLPSSWYEAAYYGVIGSTAVLGGLFFAVIIMLLNAVRGLISVVHPRMDSSLVVDEE